jgi:ribonuclease HI
MTDVVEIWTDGACSGNPGPGGWGALLRSGRHEKELYGGEAVPTTNNRMELTAPIRALQTLTRPVTVHVTTDSTYVRTGITAWVAKWQRNGWLTTAREPVRNADLWQELIVATARHDVSWHWVKGHAGHVENERADRLAAQGLRAVLGDTPPTDRPRSPRRRHAVPGGAPCSAVTKAGRPCPTTAGPSGLCHVHDPSVQCGAPTRTGALCTVATGGGSCAAHR